MLNRLLGLPMYVRQNENNNDDENNEDHNDDNDDNDSDWMDEEEEEEDEEELELEEEEEVEEEEEEKNTTSTRTKWTKQSHQQGQMKGTFHLNSVMDCEQHECAKQIQSHRALYSKKDKPLTKKHPNELFYNPASHKAHAYQTFIPNKVTLHLKSTS